jgi:hypothetical protein
MQKGAAAGKLMFFLCAQFFKDQHYHDKEWGHYIGGKVEEVLQPMTKPSPKTLQICCILVL